MLQNLTVKTKSTFLNPLTPNDHYSGRTAPLTSKRCILYIYSTNTGTAYFKHGIYSLLFSLQNAVCFIILTYLVSVLFTFYIQDVLKFKKVIPAPKGLWYKRLRSRTTISIINRRQNILIAYTILPLLETRVAVCPTGDTLLYDCTWMACNLQVQWRDTLYSNQQGNKTG